MWQYYRDEPSYTLIDSESFKPRVKITLKTPDDGNTKGVEIAIPLKYLSNFLENSKNAFNWYYEINIILTWPSTCVITNSTGAGTFAITAYIPVVTLSIQGSWKLLQQLKSSFKGTINWKNITQSIDRKTKLDHLIDSSFQRVNSLFVLAFENNAHERKHTYFLPKVDIKD